MNLFQRTLIAVAFFVAPFLGIGVRAETVVASIYWPGDGIVPRGDYATSSGQRYDARAMACAVPPGTFPLGTRLYLTRGRNAAEVVANDHGPFVKGRKLDCTIAVNDALHLDGLGTVNVEYWPPIPHPRPKDAR